MLRTPILLDQQSVKKLTISFSVIVFVVFLTGYILGFNRAESRTAVDYSGLDMPSPEEKKQEAYQHKKVLNVEPGADIDVDKVKPQAIKKRKAEQKKIESKKQNEQTPIKSVNSKKEPVDELKVASVKTIEEISIEEVDLIEEVEVTAESVQPEVITSTTYTIQIGMYGNIFNAEQLVDELNENDLDAYISDFNNENDETRYNVRIGQFDDKTSALVALETYQNDHDGSGYVVRVQQ